MSFAVLTDAGAAFIVAIFEVFSALGTAGLHSSLTGDLSKLGVIVLMVAGRTGILTLGMSRAPVAESLSRRKEGGLATLSVIG
ncbi:MAG: hypothetical protein AAGK77_03505 [Pseudomonadota bacterium]